MGGLRASPRPLVEAHDLLLMDLDGVVYIGPDPVPRAVDALNAARTQGIGVVYVTNNASRPPSHVRDHLARLGLELELELDDVLTSAQATAMALRNDYAQGTPILAIGGSGVSQALDAVGFTVVSGAEESPAVVVMGFGPDVSWRHLAEATRAIRGGAAFVATNTDLTVPTTFGTAPGNGALVRAVVDASGVHPRVIGKPQPTMFEQVVQQRAARAPLVVGDRLDTDIAGAVAAGLPSLLVMTGVTNALALINAPVGQRPSLIAPDLAGLHAAHPGPVKNADAWTCGSSTARLDGDRIIVEPGTDHGGDGLDGLRAACAAAWERRRGEPEGDVFTDVVGLATLATR
jgi:glycerol-1-phosphatase